MERSRKVQLEGRRRRVLRDDKATKSASSKRGRTGAAKLQLYVEDAVTASQPRVTDLIPRRIFGLLVWLLCGLIAVAIVQVLFVWRTVHFTDYAQAQTPALKLTGPGTLSAWISSMLLMLAAVVSLTVFTIRRHKLDDYRGRYRLWLWVATFCCLASLDASTGFHRMWQAGLIFLTERTLWGDGSIWWIGGGGALALVLWLRVIIDSWRSRGTLIWLWLTLVCYTSASTFYLHLVQIGPIEVDMMCYMGLLMTGHVLLVYSLLVYARYVYREAAGEVRAATEKKPRRRWWPWPQRRAARTQARPTAKNHRAQPETDEVAADEAETDGDEFEDVDDFDELDTLSTAGYSKSEERKNRKKRRQQSRRAA